jgi:4-amino-4-deoxy-L-arabinose transferase-like glycosyltransferase
LNSPNPALVTQRAAQRLPRLALLLFCAAYVLPGLFGRDPWRGADITAFGYMLSIAQGHSGWLAPTVTGLPPETAVLPFWLGAASIKLLGFAISPALAARFPFALLLVGVLVLTWYSTYHLARTEAAQPLPFAFGGEADPVDYARAIADGALLALIATLGLLQLGHETTPELVQLASVALFLYALSASAFRGAKPKLAMMMALPALAASGTPSVSLALGVAGTVLCLKSSHPMAQRFTPWIVASATLAAAVAWALSAWGWRLGSYRSGDQVLAMLKELAWFLWPCWPLALWTLWRWRRQLLKRHISVPLACLAVSLLASIAMGGSDRALLLGLPALAVLAAFALPTLTRGAAAAIDWFSVFFFSVSALTIWVIYLALQTGVPSKPATNVARLVPGFSAPFSLTALLLAGVATLAWVWLVQWRTGRNRHPIWKSMVLPASGVALCWLLLMTLWLPLLDHARSYRPLIDRIAKHVPRGSCVASTSLARGQGVALEYLGGYRLDTAHSASSTGCPFWLQQETRRLTLPTPRGWTLVSRERLPTSRDEVTAIYRRATPGRPISPAQ